MSTAETSLRQMSNKSHLTAITRKQLPTPVRWLFTHAFLPPNHLKQYKVLDYGCGKCFKINPSHWVNYDPYYYPIKPKGKFFTILCTYVLCTISSEHHAEILKNIQSLLTKEGIAYITVRNDKPKQGWGISKRGTYQGRATKLNLPLLHSNSYFRIYYLTSTYHI